MAQDGKEYQREYRQKHSRKIAACKKAWRERNAEEVKRKKHEYYVANKEKCDAKRKKHYEENKEKYKERDRQRYLKNREEKIEASRQYKVKNREKYLEKAKEYNAQPEVKATKLERQREDRRRFPQKHAARRLALQAVKSGVLVKQPCEVCGKIPERIEMHHDSYRPGDELKVRWFCSYHHRELEGRTMI